MKKGNISIQEIAFHQQLSDTTQTYVTDASRNRMAKN